MAQKKKSGGTLPEQPEKMQTKGKGKPQELPDDLPGRDDGDGDVADPSVKKVPQKKGWDKEEDEDEDGSADAE